MGRPPVKSNATFLGIFGNVITEKVPKGTKDSITRITDSGTERHEKQYPWFTGIITNIKYHENEYDGKTIKSWNIYITDEDDDEKFILSVPYASGYASTLYIKARNIVFARPVKIVAYSFLNENDKQKKGFNFYTDGKDNAKVENYWTKNNLPKAVEKKDKKTGKMKLDFDPINEKLEEDFIEVIEAAFNSSQPQQEAYSAPAGADAIQPNDNPDADMMNEGDPPAPVPPIESDENEEFDDKLPF